MSFFIVVSAEMTSCFTCINTALDENPIRVKCVWYTFIVSCSVCLVLGLYIFLPNPNSINGAILLLYGSLGLMFVVALYILYHISFCFDKKGLLPF